MLKFVVTLVIALSLGAHYIEGEEWLEMHSKVFGKEQITPEETYDYLVKMRDLYTGRSDEESTKRLKMANNLIKAADQVSSSNCDDPTQMSFHAQLQDYFKAHKVNVVPYIKHHARRQLELCKDKIESEINAGKQALKPGTYEKLLRFANNFNEEVWNDYMSYGASEDIRDAFFRQVDKYMRAERKIAHPKAWALRGFLDVDYYPLINEMVKGPYNEVKEKFSKVLYLGLYDADVLGPYQEIGFIFKRLRPIARYLSEVEKEKPFKKL